MSCALMLEINTSTSYKSYYGLTSTKRRLFLSYWILVTAFVGVSYRRNIRPRTRTRGPAAPARRRAGPSPGPRAPSAHSGPLYKYNKSTRESGGAIWM